MPRGFRGLAPLVLVLAVTSCGRDDPRPIGADRGFDKDAGDTRVLAEYGRHADGETVRVEVPWGTTSLKTRFDCIADRGDIEVRIGPEVVMAAACGPDSAPGGYVGASAASGKQVPTGTVSVSIKVPRGAIWSVAIDAG